jgi:AraC-like DNA-binding protein
MGQIKTDCNFSEIEAYMEELGLDRNTLRSAYNDIIVSSEEKLHAVANIAYMLTHYILTENMMSTDTNDAVDKAEQFIDDNLQNELTILEISKGTNISKSVLYKSFHSRFNCTVKEYLNQKRIEKAIDLLVHSDLSIEEIALQIGFSNASYFSKVFKKQKGISPLKFRKIQLRY